jgi:hypothetical protein
MRRRFAFAIETPRFDDEWPYGPMPCQAAPSRAMPRLAKPRHAKN